MEPFKTPNKCKRLEPKSEAHTPIRIPPSPFLKHLGYGCGVSVFTLERSPKVGFARSPWAIKKLNRKITDDKRYTERIRLEADILRKLSHPNIVGFRGIGDTLKGDLCLAMEKLDQSLGDLIEEMVEADKRSFPASDILKISFEVAKGLEYLHHTAHILHGDVKSFNILVSDNCNVVKLCDFGVSVPLTDSLEMDTSKGKYTYIGTECWSPPEVINECGPITNKADMWAYGLVIWEMIALSPPHIESDNDSTEDASFSDASFSDAKTTNESCATDMDDTLECLKNCYSSKYGTRPPLPAMEVGPEYQHVLEIFFACTDTDYKTRPSAKGVVKYFENYVKAKSTSMASNTNTN
ncbi:lymphokine-activated killer T-cell-originated protein kinase [Orussus abietinus]|uniref:lymphokine-activated killer T-cell-originated protein kinase n=1 Tax=Orussus abietinus TaxID=222816 RepID=UPI0006266C14|nr:lymphokine-activated killer T-cell-originated protein kinase [Orussus abietinus]